MTWRIPTDIFLDIHVALSLIGLVLGLIVVYGLLSGEALGAWTVLFLAALILTSVTGFPLPPFGLDPPRTVGILSLILLADRGRRHLYSVWRRLALDLCGHRDDGALPQLLRRSHSGVRQVTFLH